MGDSPGLKSRKKELRCFILQKRDALPDRDRKRYSEEITKTLLGLSRMRKSRHVLCYADFRSEVMTGSLIRECITRGKAVYLPRIVTLSDGKKCMRFYRFSGGESLLPGKWGIPEPSGDPAGIFNPEKAEAEGCFVVVPGAVFDEGCGRIGYGGGFYDRFLAKYPQFFSCGVGFSCQIAQNVPAGEFDVRPDMVVTESGVFCR